MAVELIGYRYSVYLRIARMVLLEKGVAFTHGEVDPFAGAPDWYLALHPFARVPTLRHDGFVLYETSAIARYVDAAFPGARLVPEEARALGRMQQVISIVDSYAYRPMVRQVFSNAVFRPRVGAAVDAAEISAGLAAAGVVLGALEALVDEAWMAGGQMSLADLHLAPMMAYFVAAPEGAAMMRDYPRLARWWGRIRERASMVASDPGLP